MYTYWNFPATVGGAINSINNAGIETYRGNALESLTREICQNSLDAVKDVKQPVVVEFKGFSLNTDYFPNRAEMIANFQLCKETWKGNNKKSEDFIDKALNILNKDEMNVLRISDFNTNGLEGAKEAELGSPWSSLVKEAGSSNKGESSGGSFGIGKAAPILNSNLRTLFYSSYDITGIESHIGVANIMSFKKDDSQITMGNGYFTNNPSSTAIPGQLQLDKTFTRNETGTDIFVTAFNPQRDWENVITKSVLFNFFITIFNKKLIVKINDLELTHENLARLINDLDDSEENQILKNYFDVLTSNKTLKIPYPAQKYNQDIHFKEGEAVLLLLNGEDLNRRILMTRKTGMRIFEQKNISGSISFTGILMITGSNMNNIFKQMENPAHNKWSEERYEKDPKLAKKIYSNLRKFIRETVKNKFQEQITDEMDVIGLNDFLPNKNMNDGGSTTKTESLNANVKSLLSQKKEQKTSVRKKHKGNDHDNIEEQLEGKYGITPAGEEGGNGRGTHSSGGNTGGGLANQGGQNELDKKRDGKSNKKRKYKPSSRPIPIKQKYLCVNKNAGKYRFIMWPSKTMAYGRLVFRIIGEQSDYDLPIKGANTDNKYVTVEKISSNTVYLQSLKKNRDFILDVDIDYSDYCVLEVMLYEN